MEESNGNVVSLAIIGETQAGKTTLAIGLSAVSTETFRVVAEGDATSNYLSRRRAQIEHGVWPASTDEKNIEAQ